jgi:hypothetical protein
MMHVKAWDNWKESETVTFEIPVSLWPPSRSSGMGLSDGGGSLRNCAVSIIGGILRGRRIHAHLTSLTSDTVQVSYKVDDDSHWSEPVSYELGQQPVFEFANPLQKYSQPGEHTIAFRFDDGTEVNEDEFHYKVNAPPVIELKSAVPLMFDAATTGSVSLPISVSDADADPVNVFYRLEGEEVWGHVQNVNGEYSLPAQEFRNHLGTGSGRVEIFAWDGLDKSGEALRIGYSVLASQPDAEGAAEAKEADSEDGMSPALIIGLAVGGVALVTLIVGIVIFATRNNKKSSSK